MSTEQCGSPDRHAAQWRNRVHPDGIAMMSTAKAIDPKGYVK
jgi:hypothetical protein